MKTLSLLTACAVSYLAVSLSVSCGAAERPTFNKFTNDPRPDILPYWLHDWRTEYRRAYNRPRYVGGWIAHAIEPSSQEAMVWCEAKQLGLYRHPHAPPLCKQYYAPKSWERLETGPRPDFQNGSAGATSFGDFGSRSNPGALEAQFGGQAEMADTEWLHTDSPDSSRRETLSEVDSTQVPSIPVPLPDSSSKVRLVEDFLPETP